MNAGHEIIYECLLFTVYSCSVEQLHNNTLYSISLAALSVVYSLLQIILFVQYSWLLASYVAIYNYMSVLLSSLAECNELANMLISQPQLATSAFPGFGCVVMHVCVCVTCVFGCAHMSVCLCVCMFVCMHVCVCVHVCMWV